MRKTLALAPPRAASGTLPLIDWMAVTCFAATALVWFFIDQETAIQLQWLDETPLVPALGLLTPVAGLITGIVSLLSGKGGRSLRPAFLMGACSPLVAIVGFFIGLSIAMGRFEAVRARREQDGTY
jgi:hypothetical protein